MKRVVLFLICLALLAALTPLAAQEATAELPALADLDAGWNMLSPGGDTLCSRGTPYSFFVRPGQDASRLMIYFQGGGACWNPLTCREGGTFDPEVSPTEVDNMNGIFNFDNPENPVADFTTVFVPYCTADLHFGNAVGEYGTGPIIIEHRGFVNTSAVLDWTYANFDSPSQVIVTGSSAGAFGSLLNAPYILDHYRDSQVVYMADAHGVGLNQRDTATVMDGWGAFDNMPAFIPDLANVDRSAFTVNQIYEALAANFPDALLSQYVTTADETLVLFYSFTGGSAEEWTQATLDSIDALEASLDNFSSFVAGGPLHTILLRDEFYTYMADGVRVRDWFASLVDGQLPSSARCVECDEAEIFTGE